MAQYDSIETPQDYVNYTFNVSAKGMSYVASEFAGLSNHVTTALGDIAFKTSEFLSHTEMLAMGMQATVSAAFIKATKDATNFQQQVANVKAIGGESIDANKIGNSAIEYSNKFGMATASMTEGLEALARAGITTTSVMSSVLEEGVKLSKLEGMDLEDSINNLISTTNLLSFDNVDMNAPEYAQKLKDMNQHIVSTSESAPINAHNIIQTLQHVGGYASAASIDEDDLFAVIAQLGARGTKGELAGTALRAFVSAGQKDTAQRALSRIGLDVSDLWKPNGEAMLPISEMKNVLDEALESRGYSKQEKLEFYSDFVGYKQANQIMKIDTNEVQQYKDSIANAWDLGTKLNTILGTVRGNLDRIHQTAINFMQKVGSKMLPIVNALLTPIRIGLSIIDKIPFAHTATAAFLLYEGFKLTLNITNKLVPAIAGMFSGIEKSKENVRGIRGEFHSLVDDVKQSQDTLQAIFGRDKEELRRQHFERRGASAKDKMEIEFLVASALWEQTYQDNEDAVPWEKLNNFHKQQWLNQIRGTDVFINAYNEYLQKTSEKIRNASEKIYDIDDMAKPENEKHLARIDVYIKYIFDLLNQGNTLDNRYSNTLSHIFTSKVEGNTYGDLKFKYGTDEEDIIKLREDIKKNAQDIRKKTQAFSNNDLSNLNATQVRAHYNAWKGPSNLGRQKSLEANESEIRMVFERGILAPHQSPHEGIKDDQIKIMAKAVGLNGYEDFDSINGDGDRADAARRIHDEFQRRHGHKTIREQQAIIDSFFDIEKEFEDGRFNLRALWQQRSNAFPTGPRNILKNNEQIAQNIMRDLNISSVTGQDDTQTVWNWIQEAERTGEITNQQKRIIATHTAQGTQKSNGSTVFQDNQMKFMLETREMLYNTAAWFSDNEIVLDLSDAVRQEIDDIITAMRQDTESLREGGARLGEAITEGFIVEGLGRHSPGYLANAMREEKDDVEDVLDEIVDMTSVKSKNILRMSVENYLDTFSHITDSEVIANHEKNNNPLYDDVADVFYNTWGDKGFNSAINEYMRRELTNDALEDIHHLGNGVLDYMDINRYESDIETLSQITSKSLWNTVGLPFNTILHRQGHALTSNTGLGVLTGITSTAYDELDTASYKSSGNYSLEIYAPAGTPGLDLFGWEYTLAPNLPYIEIGRTLDSMKILLLTIEQMQKIGFYPEGYDDTYRIGIDNAVANVGFADEDLVYGYDAVDGIIFHSNYLELSDDVSIEQFDGADGLNHFYMNTNGGLTHFLTTDDFFSIEEGIEEGFDKEFIDIKDSVTSNFMELKSNTVDNTKEIVRAFIEQGLERHSPGKMAKAMASEMEDVKNAFVIGVNNIPEGIIDELIDDIEAGIINREDVTPEYINKNYSNWVKSSTPIEDDRLKEIIEIEKRVRDGIVHKQLRTISDFDIEDAISLKTMYNDSDMYQLLLNKGFQETQHHLHTYGQAPDLRFTELTNPATGKKYRFNKEIGIINDSRFKNIVKTRHIDKNGIFDKDLLDLYNQAVNEYNRISLLTENDITGQNGYLSSQIGTSKGNEVFKDYSVEDLLKKQRIYRKKGFYIPLTNPAAVQEAILKGLISERQIKSWYKKGFIMPNAAYDDAFVWKARGYDGTYLNTDEWKKQVRKESDEEWKKREQEQSRIAGIEDITNNVLLYNKQKGKQSMSVKNAIKEVTNLLNNTDLSFNEDDIRNAIKQIASIDNNKVMLKELGRTSRVYSAKDLMYKDWFEQNLDVSLEALSIFGVPHARYNPMELLQKILAGEIEGVDENTKIFNAKFNAGTGSKKYDADLSYNLHKDLFSSDEAARKFFGLPLKNQIEFEIGKNYYFSANDINKMAINELEDIVHLCSDWRTFLEAEHGFTDSFAHIIRAGLGDKKMFVAKGSSLQSIANKIDKEKASLIEDEAPKVRWWNDWDKYKDAMVSLSPKDILGLEMSDILPPEFIKPEYISQEWLEFLKEYAKANDWNIDLNDTSELINGLGFLADDPKYKDFINNIAIRMPLTEFIANTSHLGNFSINSEPWEVIRNAESGKKYSIIDIINDLQNVFDTEIADAFDDTVVKEFSGFSIKDLINNKAIDEAPTLIKTIETVKDAQENSNRAIWSIINDVEERTRRPEKITENRAISSIIADIEKRAENYQKSIVKEAESHSSKKETIEEDKELLDEIISRIDVPIYSMKDKYIENGGSKEFAPGAGFFDSRDFALQMLLTQKRNQKYDKDDFLSLYDIQKIDEDIRQISHISSAYTHRELNELDNNIINKMYSYISKNTDIPIEKARKKEEKLLAIQEVYNQFEEYEDDFIKYFLQEQYNATDTIIDNIINMNKYSGFDIIAKMRTNKDVRNMKKILSKLGIEKVDISNVHGDDRENISIDDISLGDSVRGDLAQTIINMSRMYPGADIVELFDISNDLFMEQIHDGFMDSLRNRNYSYVDFDKDAYIINNMLDTLYAEGVLTENLGYEKHHYGTTRQGLHKLFELLDKVDDEYQDFAYSYLEYVFNASLKDLKDKNHQYGTSSLIQKPNNNISLSEYIEADKYIEQLKGHYLTFGDNIINYVDKAELIKDISKGDIHKIFKQTNKNKEYQSLSTMLPDIIIKQIAEGIGLEYTGNKFIDLIEISKRAQDEDVSRKIRSIGEEALSDYYLPHIPINQIGSFKAKLKSINGFADRIEGRGFLEGSKFSNSDVESAQSIFAWLDSLLPYTPVDDLPIAATSEEVFLPHGILGEDFIHNQAGYYYSNEQKQRLRVYNFLKQSLGERSRNILHELLTLEYDPSGESSFYPLFTPQGIEYTEDGVKIIEDESQLSTSETSVKTLPVLSLMDAVSKTKDKIKNTWFNSWFEEGTDEFERDLPRLILHGSPKAIPGQTSLDDFVTKQTETQKQIPKQTRTKNLPWGMPGLSPNAMAGVTGVGNIFELWQKLHPSEREQKINKYIEEFNNAIANDDVDRLDDALTKLVNFSDKYKDYRTILSRVNNLDEKQGLSQNGVKSLKDLIIPNIKTTNAIEEIFNWNTKGSAYVINKFKKQKRMQETPEEDTIQTLNGPFAMTQQIRDLINNQSDASNQSQNQSHTANQTKEKREKENQLNLRQLLNSLVINKAQRGTIQKLLMQGDNELIVKEIKRSNAQVSNDNAKIVADHLINNPSDLQYIRDDIFKTFQTSKDLRENKNAHIPIETPKPNVNTESLYESHQSIMGDHQRKIIDNVKKYTLLMRGYEQMMNVFGVLVGQIWKDEIEKEINQILLEPIIEEVEEEIRQNAARQAENIKDGFNLFDDILADENNPYNIYKYIMKDMNHAWDETAEEINLITGYLGFLLKPLNKIGEALPIINVLITPIVSVIERMSKFGDLFKGVQYGLGVLQLLDTNMTPQQAQNVGLGDMYEDAIIIRSLLGEHPEAYRKIADFSETFTEYFDMAKHALFKGIGKTIAFIIDNFIIMGPLLAGIAITIGGLWLLEKNHAKALKETEEALKEYDEKSLSNLTTYQDLNKQRKDETDEMKRQQLARREAIALYKLEKDGLEKRNLINKKSQLKADNLWGEYGARAGWQRFTHGHNLFSGEFKSQYEAYEGLTSNIRQIREQTVGNPFATSAQKEVSAFYDANVGALGEIEGYATELNKLYDEESRLIEEYGSLEAARDTEEFNKAVQEFSDATRLNGETAVKYLDWLETENKVDKATSAMKLEANMITARAQRDAFSYLYPETNFDNAEGIRNAMIYAQFDEILKSDYDKLWWEAFGNMLWGYFNVIIGILNPADWLSEILGWENNRMEIADKHFKAAEAYTEGQKELIENQERIIDIGIEAAEKADRRDYGTDTPSYYNDMPFGFSVENALTMEQDGIHKHIDTIHDILYYGMLNIGFDGVRGFKEGLNQHSPGDISRSVQQEMEYTREAFEENKEPIGQISYDVGYESAYQYGNGFKNGLNDLYEQISTKDALTSSLKNHIINNQLTTNSEGHNEALETTIEATGDAAGLLLSQEGIDSGLKFVGRKAGGKAIKKTMKDGGEYIAKTSTKQGTKTLGKTLSKAAYVIGPIITAGYAIAEHNPYEKHYNEDGSEKRALQSTGEVVGEVAGSVAATALGLLASAYGGPVVGAAVDVIAGLILEPVGEAIGGTIGWFMDEVVNTPLSGLASNINDLSGGILGNIYNFVDNSPIGQFGHSVFGFLDNATGGWLGDTWNYLSNSSIAQIGGDIYDSTIGNLKRMLFGDEEAGNESLYDTYDMGSLSNGVSYDSVPIVDNTNKKIHHDNSKNTIVIENININTEDDPEKIKTAFMNLMIEMEEQITPRQVSRVIGEPNSASNNNQDTNTPTDPNAQTDTQTNTNNDSNNTNNNNPTI